MQCFQSGFETAWPRYITTQTLKASLNCFGLTWLLCWITYEWNPLNLNKKYFHTPTGYHENLSRKKKREAGVFSCEAKVFPKVNLKGAALCCYHAPHSTLFCCCREKCFWANPNTVYSNSDIIYLSTRGPPAGLWHSQGDVLPRLHEWARSWGGRRGKKHAAGVGGGGVGTENFTS